MLEEYSNYRVSYELSILDRTWYSVSFTIKEGLSTYIIDLGTTDVGIIKWEKLLESIKHNLCYEMVLYQSNEEETIIETMDNGEIRFYVNSEIAGITYITYAKNFASIIEQLINKLKID